MILDSAGCIIYYLIGALVGVLYPARSREWARRKLCGVAFGLTALITFGLSVVFSRLAILSPLTWVFVVIGVICMLGYILVGNMCRKLHEDDGTSFEIHDSEREILDRAPGKHARRS